MSKLVTLKFKNDEAKVEPYLEFGWCLSKEALEQLSEKPILKAFMFLSVTHQGREVDRRLFPLKQGFGSLVFHRDGEHVINPLIVYMLEGYGTDTQEFEDELKNSLLSTRRRHPVIYNENVYDYSGKFLPEIISRMHHGNWKAIRPKGQDGESYVFEEFSDGISVDVPKEFFAKEAPKWLSSWVNFSFKHPPVDQCDFRRRALFAFSIQPLLVVVFFVVVGTISFLCRLIYTLTAILVGRRYWGLRRLFLPLSERFEGNDHVDFDLSILEDWNSREEFLYWSKVNDFYRTNKKGEDRWRLWRWFRPITLLSLAAVTSGVYMAYWFFGEGALRFLWFILEGMMGHGVLLASVVILLVVWVIWRKMSYKHQRNSKTKKSRRGYMERIAEVIKEEEKKIAEEERKEIQSLFCDGGGVVMSYEQLPPKKRTVKLYFAHFKGKVCRPFSLS